MVPETRPLDAEERQELLEELLDALAERGAADGMRLLDLMRAEQGLVAALSVVRGQIDLLVRNARADVREP